MDAWSALIIFAGPVSAISFLWLWAFRPDAGVARERETLARAICGSLTAMNLEMDRLVVASGRARIEGKRAIFARIGRLEEIKEEMLCLGGKLRYPGLGGWGETRDETLAALEKMRRCLAGNIPEPAERD